MRAVAARVRGASVEVDGRIVGAIEGEGLLVLLGITHADGPEDVERMARKIHELRVFPTGDGARSASDLGFPVRVVSQFTLYADTRKGRRPSWTAAARPEVAAPLVDAVVAALRDRGAHVQTGVFGADMKVASVNDGPFTVLVET